MRQDRDGGGAVRARRAWRWCLALRGRRTTSLIRGEGQESWGRVDSSLGLESEVTQQYRLFIVVLLLLLQEVSSVVPLDFWRLLIIVVEGHFIVFKVYPAVLVHLMMDPLIFVLRCASKCSREEASELYRIASIETYFLVVRCK